MLSVAVVYSPMDLGYAAVWLAGNWLYVAWCGVMAGYLWLAGSLALAIRLSGSLAKPDGCIHDGSERLVWIKMALFHSTNWRFPPHKLAVSGHKFKTQNPKSKNQNPNRNRNRMGIAAFSKFLIDPDENGMNLQI